MIETLDKILAKAESKTSILIKEIDTGKVWYEKDSDIPVVSASIIKVPIMLGTLDLVCRGDISLDDRIRIREEEILEDDTIHRPGDYSIEELVSWMIMTSDNTATNALLRTYGMDYYDAYIRDVLEVKDTRIERYMLDFDAVAAGRNNYTSNLDMYEISKKLYHHEILDDELCRLAIDILSRQRDFDKLLSAVYKKYSFAHKTGSLEHLHHDVGVVSEGSDYYVGVFIWDTPDISGDKDLMEEIGKTIFDGLSKMHS